MTFEEWLGDKHLGSMELEFSKDAFVAGAASRDAEIAELRSELETEQMRNVACGVVAMADTPDSAKQARDMHPDYMSATCQDVARRVDECIKLREQVNDLRGALKESYPWERHFQEKCDCQFCQVLAATEPKP